MPGRSSSGELYPITSKKEAIVPPFFCPGKGGGTTPEKNVLLRVRDGGVSLR